jgi:hypothetical protein
MADGDVPADFQAQLNAQREQLAAKLKELESQRSEKPGKIAWLTDISADPPPTHLLERGNYSTPGPVVEPGVISAITDPAAPFQVQAPSGGKSTGRRTALANWLTRPGSPAASLMARVQVNRIWQQHYGAGLVATPENLGYSGAAASHPELLEFLAAQFVESGWSIKALHRLILNSAVYRQSDSYDEAAARIDPDDRYLWRYPLRRLDAEALRDTALAVSGRLDRKIGGPYVPTKRTGDGEIVAEPGSAGGHRRSIYLYQRRTQVLSMLGVFDSPSIVFNCVKRVPSTVPLQSLGLLNSQFAIDCAQSLAERLGREAPGDAMARVEHGFVLAMGRPPTDVEQAAAKRFLSDQAAQYQGSAEVDKLVWRDFCQMLLASSPFLYVD